MDGTQKQACVYGGLLLGFYTVYMLSHPESDGAILSVFIGALTAYGGYTLGRRNRV